MSNDVSQQHPAKVTVDQVLQQAIGHHRAGQLQDAERLYQSILHSQPYHPDANHNLGVLAVQINQLAAALPYFKAALEANPDIEQFRLSYASAQCKLGNAQLEQGQLDAAMTSYRRAVEIGPDLAEAHCGMGAALKAIGRHDEAVASYRRALGLKPDLVEGHNNLGIVLQDLGRVEQAAASYRHALGIAPDCAQAHSNLGNAQRDLGQLDQAVASCQRALVITPAAPATLNNVGNAQKDRGRLGEAIASFRKALVINPDFADASNSLGLALLLKGHFDEGWKRNESRSDSLLGSRLSTSPRVIFPKWQGQSLAGKRLLVWYEQGLGDQIQFCRYLSVLRAQGTEHITLVCSPSLRSLLKRFNGADEVLTIAEAEDIPRHDYWTFPLSIPLYCATTIESIPASIPYMYADANYLQTSAAQLSGIQEFTVGVCWHGGSAYPKNAERSPGLEPFKRLFALDCVRFFTLQPNTRDQFLSVAGSTAQDLGHEIDSLTPPFEETAALIMNLDLVITCDTSIGHLAGALGKPVWIVLPFVPDWRWMMDREDSPWYPNTRLFRQTIRGDWAEVFERVARRLESVVAGAPIVWPIAATQ